jgi:ankyrin repeat protein
MSQPVPPSWGSFGFSPTRAGPRLGRRRTTGGCPCTGYASLKVVRWLANKSSDGLKVQTNDGMLPLHIAARDDRAEIVLFLARKFEGGIETPTADGWRPIHYAACYSTREIVQLLADEAWARSCRKPTTGMLPLHFAARHATPAIVLFLGALEARSSDGLYPVHSAALSDGLSLDVVYLLALISPRALAPAGRPL